MSDLSIRSDIVDDFAERGVEISNRGVRVGLEIIREIGKGVDALALNECDAAALGDKQCEISVVGGDVSLT